MNATATGNLVVYLDGVQQPISPNADIMFKADSFEIPPSTSVIAMKCDDNEDSYNGYCRASFDNGWVTDDRDDSWRCTGELEEGWFEVDHYDDSAWWIDTWGSTSGFSVGVYGDWWDGADWPEMSDINADAQWLGSHVMNDATVYCRRHVGKWFVRMRILC